MTKEFAFDLLERVVATFVGAAVTVLAANGTDITELSVWESAAITGGAAVIALVKGLLARYVGAPDSAALRK